jgi:BirA family biotin operon repressor/biotin-[acetyl-CoA-carboxylase] ligase
MDIRFFIHDEVTSTQDVVIEAAKSGEPEGYAVMARRQTQGRGRTGRTWISPGEKNLALSVLLRPTIEPAGAPLIGLLASVAVANALDDMARFRTSLKWPNDVLVNGQKTAGILSEAEMTADKIEFVAVGVGVNVNSERADFPAEFRNDLTSMKMAAQRHFAPEDVARFILEEMDRLDRRLNEEGPGFISSLWETRWAHKGQTLSREGISGIGERIDPDGALVLRTTDGRTERISSGELFVAGQ